MGRPKITLQDFKSNWEDAVLELASQGGSDVEIRANILHISQDCWERLLAEDEYFSLTIKKAHDLCHAWWLTHGRAQLQNKNFSAVLWYMNMKNRFGWKDKQEISTDPSAPFTINFVKKDSEL